MANGSTPTTLLDLPVDLLVLVFPYLDAASFLSLTSTCTALHTSAFMSDSTFWSMLVRRDFRVPNQPVVQHDGKRWAKLYKRLRTQSRIFTWGSNERFSCLGHAPSKPDEGNSNGRFGGRLGRRIPPRSRNRAGVGWPVEMAGTEELGIISDLQCGGWSTSLLTSKGALYAVGVLDGQAFDRRRPPYQQVPKPGPTALRFPPGWPHPKDRYDPATATKQFSAGRAHILGLSDSGRIWTWHDIDEPGSHVKFVHHDTVENGQGGRGTVKKVVAGWNKSSALVESSGIVLWDPLRRHAEDCDITDTELVLQTAHVSRAMLSANGNEDTVGDIANYILLEDTIVLNTTTGKAFASLVTWTEERQTVSQPIELSIPTLGNDNVDESFVTDVQGSFRNFAVFTKSGAVLTSDQDRLMPLLQDQPSSLRLFKRIPALQNQQVISLAFGDWHYHALHASGYITSYGNEPQGCGAMGLGGRSLPEGRIRGMQNQGMARDAWLVPHAYTEGRRIWFEDIKRDWATFLTSGGVDEAEASERLRFSIGSQNVASQGEISEWIEQEGRDWEEKYGVKLDGEADDGLSAYFALRVTAAGWHSGAVVLVNEELAEKLNKAVEVPDNPSTQQSQDDKIDVGPSNSPPAPQPTSPNPERSWTDSVVDFGRYFLGLAPYNVSSGVYDPNAPHLRHTPTATANNQHHRPDPESYGASPREGYHYVWANDHFPRLKLSDGTEMPGEVPFDEWRYGRPEWKLNWENEG